jgi:hypothetical protein
MLQRYDATAGGEALMTGDEIVRDAARLRELYGSPREASIKKQVDTLHPLYQEFIRASPFAIVATAGPQGLDASPRGDAPGFVAIADERTLLLPDRRGNNRIDGLLNLMSDPRVALLFFVPGVDETIRVNGTAEVSIRPDLLARFTVDGKRPQTVLVVHVQEAFFQCGRALMRSELWNPATRVDRASLPSAGKILAALSRDSIDGAQYDRELPQRMRDTLY